MASGPASCANVRAGEPFVGKQGFAYAPAVSAETVGARAIHMQILTMPPGARAKAHKHERHETAIYVLSGEAGTWYGERLEHHIVSRAGDFVYIPAERSPPAVQPERHGARHRRRRPHRSERAGERCHAART